MCAQIESSLQRNNSARKFHSEQSYRLQQSFLVSSTHDMIDRYIVDLLDSIATLERHGGEQSLPSATTRDIRNARALMQDAENSRQVRVGSDHVIASNILILLLKYWTQCKIKQDTDSVVPIEISSFNLDSSQLNCSLNYDIVYFDDLFLFSLQLLFDLQRISSKCDESSSDVPRKLSFMTDDLQATLQKYLKVKYQIYEFSSKISKTLTKRRRRKVMFFSV